MISDLEERIRKSPKSLVGNRGYARYVKVAKDGMVIDRKKIDEEARFDGKWVLRTNMTLPPAQSRSSTRNSGRWNMCSET